MVGEEFLIGVYQNADSVIPHAREVLANALGWEISGDKVKHPYSNLYITITKSRDEYILRVEVSNGIVSSGVDFSDVTDRNLAYVTYWSIIKNTDGVVAITLHSYMKTSGAGVRLPIHPFVFAVNTNDVWSVLTVTGDSVNIISDDTVMSTQLTTPSASKSSIIKYTSLAKFPDPIHGGTFNGLYSPLFVSVTTDVSDAYELNGKRYCNILKANFMLSMALG